MFIIFFSWLLVCSGCAHKPKTLQRNSSQKFYANIRRMTLASLSLCRKENCIHWKAIQKNTVTVVDTVSTTVTLLGHALFFFEPNGFVAKQPTVVLDSSTQEYIIPEKYRHHWCVARPIYDIANQNVFGPISNIITE